MFPIGTDIRTRRVPTANIVLIALNVLIFLFTDVFVTEIGKGFKSANMLDAARPNLHQYITYQFLHGDAWHLVGNMVFLWVFGNAVCDKMGAITYVLFYLAGGVSAAAIFATGASNPMLGASGAIAAVTTAFLAFFPRSRVNMLVVFVFITAFELPSMVVILGKIILWDNIIAPRLGTGLHSNVAYSAHLAGYLFGFAVSLLLLATRALPRNQFDILALWDRQRRRAAFASAGVVTGEAMRLPRVSVEELGSRPLEPTAPSPIEKLRMEVMGMLEQREVGEAARLYVELMRIDRDQCLPPRAQLELANYLAQTRMHEEAVTAYEAYLRAFPAAADADQVRLLVGLICNRYLRRADQAAHYLRAALNGLTQPSQRELASEELELAESGARGT